MSHDLSWAKTKYICEMVKWGNMSSCILSVFKTWERTVMLTLYKSILGRVLELAIMESNEDREDTTDSGCPQSSGNLPKESVATMSRTTQSSSKHIT